MNSIRAEHITKNYPGTVALDDVSLSFESGKIHAFVGKNGSGKSTLLKIFAGAELRTTGKIMLNDKEVSFLNPAEACSVGIATVFQELSLIPSISVAENIFIGRLPTKKNHLVDWKRIYSEAEKILQSLGIDIDPRKNVSELPISQRQLVEIAKAMSHNPQVLQLDEPTSALSRSEVDRLFVLLKELKKKDVVIVFVTHRMEELWQIADDCAILRDGRFVGAVPLPDTDRREVIQMMFGDIEVSARPTNLSIGDETVLRVVDLTRKQKFEQINFELKKGEILGIAGMLGSGRTELLRSIFGADTFDSGYIEVKGKHVSKPSTGNMREMGVAMLQEDRKNDGIIARDSILMNATMSIIGKLGRGIFYSEAKAEIATNKQVGTLGIKLVSIHNKMNSLSGGNQQKVIVGRWLNTEPEIFLFDEPSRGIDVASKQQIFDIMWGLSEQGVSSIVVSSELEELLGLCTRILIMQQGRIINELHGDSLDNMSIDDLYILCMEGIQ